MTIGCEGGNISIAQHRCAWLQNRLPAKAASVHAIQAAASQGIDSIAHAKYLADFAQFSRTSGEVSCDRRGAAGLERNDKYALIFRADQQLPRARRLTG